MIYKLLIFSENSLHK